jgi:hypothetical protein
MSGRVDDRTRVQPLVVVAPRIELAGVVLDWIGAPLGEVRVSLQPPNGFRGRFEAVLDTTESGAWNTRSDEQGRFQLAPVPWIEGSTLVAELEGFEPWRGVVKANKRFTHLAMSAFDVRENNLPKRVDWLLLDMNTEPDLGLRAVEHQIKLGRMPTYAVILTLKLNQPSFSTRIPELVNRVRSRGFPTVYAKQLTANRREITVVGLTERELRRA